MAGNRDRERGSYGRSDSIFDDDHGNGRNQQSGRGFFQRAGEEVRSWLGGDDRERMQHGSRSRYGDYQAKSDDQGRSYEGSSGTGWVQSWGEADHNQGPNEPWGGGSDWNSGSGWPDDMGQGSHDQSARGNLQYDDHYRSWRERQINELDREYDEYRQHRQQRFESEFASWRESRRPNSARNPGGATEIASGRTGSQGQSEGSGTTSAQGGSPRSSSPAMPSGGATTEGGSNLAPDASTGGSARLASPRGRKS
ncbi:MAG: hypothetical protein H0W74_08035 [Sphingosinicella sp.]|nr:hypothetical protein [Sphingosinicella sp.]